MNGTFVLTLAERGELPFAGRGLTRDDLAVINAADRAFTLGGTIVTTQPAGRRSIRGRTS